MTEKRTKVDIISGFLGAGKTTLIRKLIKEAYGDKKIIIIENEFGEIGVDTGFLKDTGVTINEITAGCICCTLAGDFAKALDEVMREYKPDIIVIEPSGVGKLSDVILAVKSLGNDDILLNSFACVVDAKKARKYLKNFGEFFENQVENAGAIILSHTSELSAEKIDDVVNMLRELNKEASIITTDWEDLDGKDILEAMEQKKSLDFIINKLREEPLVHHHEHDHDHHHGEHDHENEDQHDHDHGHHHEHGEHDHDHEHNHHDHEHHHEHEHEHHHDHHHHDDNCGCGHDHNHEHGHDADEVFSTVGIETAKAFTLEQIKKALDEIEDDSKYGMVIRAKGIVKGEDEKWLHFDYVPGEADIRDGSAEVTGMICVIGVDLKEKEIRELFSLEGSDE